VTARRPSAVSIAEVCGGYELDRNVALVQGAADVGAEHLDVLGAGLM
jgi:hypothetical protein